MSGRVVPVARKEFREMRRDPITMWIAAFLPVVMLFLFGYAVSLDVEDVPAAVLDRDRSSASARLVEALENSESFTVRRRPTEEKQVRRLLDAGEVGLAVVVPHGFSEELADGSGARVQTLVDATYSATAAVVRDEVEALLADFARREYEAGGSAAAGASPPGLPGEVRVQPRVWYNPSLESATFVIPGLFAVILLAFPPLLTVLGVVREKESGSIHRVFVSPLRPWEFLVGKTLPYATVAFGELATVTALGVWWFDVPVRGSPLLLLTASVVYVLCTVGIGLFVSTLTESQVVAVLLALIITLMPAFLFSGFMFPISAMPEAVQGYTRLFPGRYFTELSRGLFLKGSGLSSLARPLLMLTAYTAVVFGAATFRLRREFA